MKQMSNLSLWDSKGENLLVLQPFMDSVIVRGEGCYLVDVEGRRILDMAAGQFCNILGYNHPGFVEKLKEQTELLIHLGDQYVSPGVLTAAAKLSEIAPGDLKKVVLLSTGSEANECAMRMAKAVTGRTGMLGFTRGYYGTTLATRNLSSISDYPWKVDFQPTLANQHKLITPTCGHCPVRLDYPGCGIACLEVSLEMIAHNLESIAAVIVEPVLSAGGMVFPPEDYLRQLFEVARWHGLLVIVDEAQTGFGRCGKWFDIENYNLQPDILVVSKTAGNGYPAAAVIVSEPVARKLERLAFTHLSSHQNDPLAAAVVLTVIDIVEEEKLCQHSLEMGDYFMERLKWLKERHRSIAQVRGRGLMVGMELNGEAFAAKDDNTAFKLAMLCEQQGLHITFSYFEPVIRFLPPLIVSREEIDQAVCVLDKTLSLLESGAEDVSLYAPQNLRSGPFVKRLNGRVSVRELARKVWQTAPREWFDKARRLL